MYWVRTLMVGAVIFFAGCSLTVDGASNTLDISQTDFSKLEEMKKGEACVNNLFFLFYWGDNNLSAAAADGEISHVTYIKKKADWFIIFNKVCTVAYGK